MPEPPILDLIAAGARDASAGRELASRALAQLSAEPPGGPVPCLLALALLEYRDAQDRAVLTLATAEALLREGEAIGIARERAAQQAARSRLHAAWRLSPHGKEPATVG